MMDYEKRRAERKARLARRIERQTLSVNAIHHVAVTREDIVARLAANPNWTSLSLDYLLDITRDLYLIEVATDDLGVVGAQLIDVTQDNEHGQAPWDERYFDTTGTRILDGGDYKGCPPDEFAEPGRIRFFMHYFDPNLDLLFNGFALQLPSPTPLPGWLAEAMPYDPPN